MVFHTGYEIIYRIKHSPAWFVLKYYYYIKYNNVIIIII